MSKMDMMQYSTKTVTAKCGRLNLRNIVLALLLIYLSVCGVQTFNVDTKNVKIFRGPKGIYFGYSLAMLRNFQGNWLLVGAPKAFDPLTPQVVSPGVLLRCPLDGDSTTCAEVVVDTTGNSRVAGTFYGVTKVFQNDKTNQWLGVAVDVAPSNDRIAVCAHRWKDSKFVVTDDLLYMHGMCYELDGGFQRPARLLPILVDYRSLVHMTERYPIWAYGTLGQSVQYTKNGDSIVMGAPGLNDWQGGFVIEDNMRRNFTIQPLAERRNWMIGYTIATARLIRSDASYIIAGAPRANLNGSVYIFKYKSDQLLTEPLIGEQLGSYFGSVICAADINGDQLDDVIIGAPFYSTNNTEEGRVYVYLNRGLHRLELQDDILNGSSSQQARFGSAIANIGDINKDSFNDIAIGAPYENEGVGTVYIYNGYSEGIWPRFTQRIRGQDIDPGLRSFGAALTHRSVNTGEVFAVGAYDSDSAVVLRVNPVVSMKTTTYVKPDIITKSGPYIDVVTCFKYTGAASTLQETLDITYTMSVDTTTPEGSVRAIVVPDNVPYISRALKIKKGEFVCDKNVRIYAPYQDIWRDVELDIIYELDKTVSDRCTSNCPILEKFNGKDPQASSQYIIRKTIQYNKQCGDDNICDTGLSMKILPLANNGEYIVSGKDHQLEVKVGLINSGENAYNIIVDINVTGNLSSSVRAHEQAGYSIVDCVPLGYDIEASVETTLYRCRVRKPYPLKNMEEMTFKLIFPLDNHMSMSEFTANFSVKTEDQKEPQAYKGLKLPIKSQYGLRIEGLSGPEQVTLGVQQDTNTWTNVEHRYSIKNLGPSPMENAEIRAFVPAIIHRNEALVTNISVWLTTYESKNPIKQRCYETSSGDSIPSSDSSGGYAVSVDCSSFPCRHYECSMMSFLKDQSILVSVNMSVSRQILVRLQARDTVRLASRISIPGISLGKSLEKEVDTMFHKTTNDMERKKINIPIWLMIVSVVSAFLVLLVIVAILIKVGFFKRSKKEEMKRLMSTRGSSPFSKSSSNETPSRSNVSTNSSNVLGGIEETNGAMGHDQGHVNPMAEDVHSEENRFNDYKDRDNDDVFTRRRNNNFLNDLNAHLHHAEKS